jgi:hypothetical protein
MKIRHIYPVDNEDGFAEVIVTREEAIKIQRECVAKVRPEFVYKNDEEALMDYMNVNWADEIPD